MTDSVPIRRLDILSLGVRCEVGAQLVGDTVSAAQPWARIEFRPTPPLEAGWWRVKAESELDQPFRLAFWGRDSGAWLEIQTSPDRASFVQMSGVQEITFWPGPAPGVLKAVRLSAARVSPAASSVALLGRLFRGGIGRLRRGEVKELFRSAVALVRVGKLASFAEQGGPGPPRPLSKSAISGGASGDGPRFAISIEGAGTGPAAESTLASLDAQSYRRWSLQSGPADIAVKLHAGDVLAPDALNWVAEVFAARPGLAAAYADAAVGGVRTAKPEWDPDLAAAAAYTGRPVFFRISALQGPEFDAGDDEGRLLALERAGRGDGVARLPLVLLERSESGQPSPPDEARRTRVLEHYRQAEPHSRVQVGVGAAGLRLRRKLLEPPLASVVVPTRDRAELLEACMAGLMEQTAYAPLDVVLVDNGSSEPAALEALARWGSRDGVRVIRSDEPFNFSRLCNLGARAAKGEVLCFLNNDVVPTEPDWLAVMVGEALRPEIGAVGSLLLYPDGSVQHAGVVLGLRGVAGHAWRGETRTAAGLHPRIALVQRRSAVTGACLVVRRDAFDLVDGFDEVRFPITLNDVDLCLRLAERGLATLYTPEAVLIHNESRSRRPDTHPLERARTLREQNAFRDRWLEVLDDPYFSPALTHADESARLRD